MYLGRGLYSVFAALCLLSSTVISCSGDDDAEPPEEETYDCDGEWQTGTVAAAEWVSDNTDIARYDYASDPDGDIVVLTLLDDEDAELGELTIEGFFGTNEHHHQVETVYETDGEESLSMTTDGLISNDHAGEFRTRTIMERGEDAVAIRSDFEGLSCYANDEPDEEAGHRCVWPAPVFDARFSVPSCGFDVSPELPMAPNLRSLEYRVPTDADPGVGGLLLSGDTELSTFTLIDSGIITGADEVDDWLNATGSDAIIGSDAEQLATAAYADPHWMDGVEEHARACLSEQFGYSEGELQTVRQAHHPGGFDCAMEDAGPLLATDDVETIRQPGGGGCDEECADGCGKPHLRTYDGSSYPFHAAGEFTLAHADVGPDFEIQMRTRPGGDMSCRGDIEACQQITVITAVAMDIDGTRVALYRDRQPHLYIDGEPVERISDDALSSLPPTAGIHQKSEYSYRFDWPSGEALEVQIGDFYLDLHGILPTARYGQVSGLWGNFTNIASDDFTTRSGEVIEKPVTFDVFYDEFVESWRIDADDSLFDYDDGESPDDLITGELPEHNLTVSDLPADLRAEAQEACSDVVGQPDLNWCIFDVVCMCDESVAESTDHLGPHESMTDMHPTAPLTATGDLCLGAPPQLEYRAAEEPSCPPEDRPCVYLLREQHGVELTDELRTNAVSSGIYASDDDLASGVIPAGMEVDSYLLHVNEAPQDTELLRGEMIASQPILGLIADGEDLLAADGSVGLSGTTYDDGDRGVDLDTSQFELDTDRNAVRIEFDATDGISELRVLTAAAQ